ncbi:MFS transporter [Hydrogenobacter thermophilus]|uniref:MFS transporter n=1 Tax=Hydrogenobacter thermophilus TaxID=940 RepID=UPI0030F963D0
MEEKTLKKRAYRIVLLFGIVSLLADLTYEGARSIIGPYMSLLGASAFAVSFIAGLGEFVGYALRLVFGYLADRTRLYWGITITGYLINLFSVPLLALAPSWQWAGFLLLLERMGKSVRAPSRDALLSFATKRMGHGLGFGVHEFFDQIGALSGPLLVSAVMFLTGNYRLAFALLGVPAFMALLTLIYTRISYTESVKKDAEEERDQLKSTFFLYILASSLVAMGYADFALMAYHIKTSALLPDGWVPLLYAAAMGVDAIFALLFGVLFDRIGFYALMLGVLLASPFSLFAFSLSVPAVCIGIALWGLGMGIQESIMRSAIAKLTPPQARGKAFGIFHFFYGLFWFIGSAILGYLYQVSLAYLMTFSVLCQIISLVPLFILSKRVSATYRSSG